MAAKAYHYFMLFENLVLFKNGHNSKNLSQNQLKLST